MPPKRRTPVRRGVASKQPARRATPKPASKQRGRKAEPLTAYATKPPTDYHKAFARWIVQEVGYEPTNRKDFLMAVSIATTTRSKFMASDFLTEWREKTDTPKRGPKPAATPAKGGKPKPAPEPEEDEFEDDDEFEDEEDEFEEDSDDDDDEFEDDDEESEEDDDFENDDDEFEDEEEEEEEPVKPAPKRRAPAVRKGAPARSAKSKVPARGKAKSTPVNQDDEEVLF
jgi:hypothetical protein